ncbi:TPA: hypothetical protein N2B65_003933 [Pseudomonas aeruginosa]|uniref:hypothetical protein n=1 Tax=Pseudomonas aeruginosa TaxID=287 RepID=UPI000EB1E10F|nr:hypothetical protein [Pseudomonas aeruginosa]MDI3649730.1 hypothetical protein [Pseudomonas aeruginosa]RQF81594.1 hypothetical protein IPC258_02795 [Pseudomonas aeruginosa]WRH84876.1 hypothetical protein RDJ20_12620 [Pseudomonas aeruginosa]HCL3966261.1 hypothetical protein [Pseudomonas aeruginosa]
MKNTDAERGDIVLSRQVSIFCWHVIGEVARATQRPELLPLLQRAGVREAIDAHDIAVHLFCEPSRQAAAQRLLDIACGLGLLQPLPEPGAQSPRRRSYSLTELGQDALQRQQVFVPEYACWRLWASDDPLLECPVLLVEPFEEPRARQDVYSKEPPAHEKIPAWLNQALRKTITPPGNKEALRIELLEKNLQPQKTEATLVATWDVDQSCLQLHGNLGGTPIDTPSDAPQLSAQAVWHGLLQSAGMLDDWDDQARALKRSFDSSSDAERNSLRGDLRVPAPELAELGSFDDLRIARVALTPRSHDDAQRWARWRLLEHVNHYASSERFNTWTVQAYAPFLSFELSAPRRKDLAEQTWQRRENSRATTLWHLVAAEDWGL